jgi:hypothetical protein
MNTSHARSKTLVKTLILKDRLKEKYKDILPQKCIADEIWLYCRYLFDNIASMTHNGKGFEYFEEPEETKQQFYNKMQELYQQIRGETFYQGWKTASIAGGIFYIVSCLYGVYLTQPDICEKLYISSVGLRRSYLKLREFYRSSNKI